MKKLVGTFKTEEEMILAINDLKNMGLDPHEISVVTHDPYEYNTIVPSDEAIRPGGVQVGSVYDGEGVHHFVDSLRHYGIPEEKANLYHQGYRDGDFLVFIGLDDEIRNHIDNPGTYMAPDLIIDDIETPGTYTLLTPYDGDPDTPGDYVAEEYGNRPHTPGTYEDPIVDERIKNPGTYTEDDVIDPDHHMVRNPDEMTHAEKSIYERTPVDAAPDDRTRVDREVDNRRVDDRIVDDRTRVDRSVDDRTHAEKTIDRRTPVDAQPDDRTRADREVERKVEEDRLRNERAVNERDLIDNRNRDKVDKNVPVEELDPFDPDKPQY